MLKKSNFKKFQILTPPRRNPDFPDIPNFGQKNPDRD